jgi:hypothetical protein
MPSINAVPFKVNRDEIRHSNRQLQEVRPMLRITLSIVPYGNESRQYPIGNIEICNIEDNGDGTANYAVVMQKHGPYGKAYCIADDKSLLTYDERGRVVAIRDHDDDDIRVVQVHRHHRKNARGT